MSKKYALYQLKQWLPIIGVSFAFLAIFFWIQMGTMNITYPTSSEYTDTDYYVNRISTGLYYIIIPVSILTLVLPFAVYDYRFKKNRADTFLQVPMNERELKRTRLLLGLCVLEAIFTFVYWIGVLILAVRASTITLASGYDAVNEFRFTGYLYVYLIMLVVVAADFFIHCYLTQLGNNVSDSVLYLLLGEFVLACLIFCPVTYFYLGLGVGFSAYFTEFNFSMLMPIALIMNAFDGFVRGTSQFISLSASGEFFSVIGFILIGGGTAFLDFYVRDPSGEYYGSNGERNKFIGYLPHLAAFLGGIVLFTLGFYLAVLIIIYLLWALVYYIILVFLNRSFKLKKQNLIPFLAISAVVLVLELVAYYI